MDWTAIQQIQLRDAILVFIICAGAALIAVIALLVSAARQVATTDIPEDADFFETLQRLPITVPLALDLLDLVFDFFAAPIAWVILELLGLHALKMITVFEGLIPGTQLIPTMTIAWFLSRMMNKRQRQSRLRSALHEYQLEGRRSSYSRLGSGGSLADEYRRRALPSPDSDEVIDGEYFEEDFDDLPSQFYDEEEW